MDAERLDVVAGVGDDGQVGAELLLYPGGEFGPAGAAREEGDAHRILASQGAAVYCCRGMRLDGRKALVTGGASGIGAAIAERLAAEGAEVWVGDVDVPGAEKVAGEINGHAIELDVTDLDVGAGGGRGDRRASRSWSTTPAPTSSASSRRRRPSSGSG